MTTLHSYLKSNQIRQAEFAALIGVKQATISRLASGKITPSVSLAAEIKKATGGAVDFEAWLDATHPPKTPEAAR